MDENYRIWILESDPENQALYQEVLGIWYRLKIFSDFDTMRVALVNDPTGPDLLVAELMNLGDSFLSFLKEYSARPETPFPLIVTSGIDDLDALRVCFKHGAVDYIKKPISKNELILRIETVLSRKMKNEHRNRLMEVDAASMTVKRGSKQTQLLTSKEFQIMSLLASAPDFTITRTDLVEKIWGQVCVGTKTLDVHLVHLRRKLEPLSLAIRFIAPGCYSLADSNIIATTDPSTRPHSTPERSAKY